MRLSPLALAAALSACALPSTGGPVTTTALASADAATSLAIGENIFLDKQVTSARDEGQDAMVNLTLRHADGRRIAFQEANQAPHDLFVQQPGGALAQVMAAGVEAPALYRRAAPEGANASFICGAEGPAAIGVLEGADGTVRIVGLRQDFQVETLPNGELNAVPYSPDQVCARLNFRQG